MLDTVHHQGVRLATGAFRTSPIPSLYAETGEPPLSVRRQVLCLQLYCRLQSMHNTPTYATVMNRARDVLFSTLPYHVPLGPRARGLLERLPVDELNIMKGVRYLDSPWRAPIPELCPWIRGVSKSDNHPEALKAMFLQHLHEQHTEDEIVYTDGSKTETGTGYACIFGTGPVQHKLSDCASVYSAELLAILHVLALLVQKPGHMFTVVSDSLSALHAISDRFSRHPIVVDIHVYVRILQRAGKSVKLCWVPSHVGIAGNEKADSKAREIAERGRHRANHKLPHRDYYPSIRKALHAEWHAEWQDQQLNELRTIKDTTSPWATSHQRDRRTEVLLCRLRIGHTRLIHLPLLRGEAYPLCEGCFVFLTVHHILIDCPNYVDIRRRIYGAAAAALTISDVLGDDDHAVDKLFRYLREINILYDL